MLHPMMKISVITNISVFRFYEYIGDILTDILTQNIDRPKIGENLLKYKIKLLKMKLEV